MGDATATMTDELTERIAELEEKVARLTERARAEARADGVAIVCFSGEWDRLLAAFTIANGALAMAKQVHMFFTFWGAAALLKNGRPNGATSWIQRLMSRLLPKGASAAPLSRMGFCGLSKPMLKRLMRDKGIDDLPELVAQAKDLGARFHCCDTSFSLFGWGCDDIEYSEGTDWCGIASFLGKAYKSKITLFI